MKRISLLVFCLLPVLGFSQFEITIKANVIDEETREPIQFANVEFLNKPLNEITREDGSFVLSYDENLVSEQDIFEVSAFGYESQDISAKQFYRFLTNTNKIFLRQKPGVENQVVKTKDEETTSVSNAPKALTGTISVKGIPVQGAKVSIKNSFKEATTDPSGSYAINAQIGDVLSVKFLGMLTQEIEVKSLGDLDITMESDGELLEEVFLSGQSIEKPQIDLGYNGKKTFDEITYSANTIGPELIRPYYYQLSDLLRGRTAKTSYSRDMSLYNQSNYIYDIDGMIFSSAGGIQLPFIDPQIIESITVLNSLTATHKYGTLGRAGVIVIRTKNIGYDRPVEEKPSALVKGNDYAESVELLEGSHRSDLGQKLKQAESFEEAKAIFSSYVSEIDMPGVDVYFNASDYFKRWNMDFALSLLEKVGEVGYNNTKALRGLAFKYEELGKNKEVKEVFQRVAVLSPKEAQTYMDLARSYNLNGDHQAALDLLKTMMMNNLEGVDFTGLRNSIENEIQHILAFHRTKVNYQDLPMDLRTANFKYDVRVFCEWNDPYAEFELQFVNPGKRYFVWRNKKLHNTQRMLDGVKNGFAMEEFVIDDAAQGEWIINLKATEENPGVNPTFFKYTVYTDYGLPTETSETRVIQLANQAEKVTIDRLRYE